jgi:hypothetical protein
MPPDFGPPNLTSVTRLADEIEFRSAVERVEIWRKLWKRAIVRAVVPHLLAAGEGGAPLTGALQKYEGGMLSSISGSRSITFEFEQILNENTSLPELLTFLDDSRWHEIDEGVVRNLSASSSMSLKRIPLTHPCIGFGA